MNIKYILSFLIVKILLKFLFAHKTELIRTNLELVFKVVKTPVFPWVLGVWGSEQTPPPILFAIRTRQGKI
jgi:hypothetical protein